MTGWNNQCGINGGFLWLYDDIVGTGLAAQYATAINNAVTPREFTLSGPHQIYLNQSGTTAAGILITDMTGFNGAVTLTVSNLPKGVEAKVLGTGTQRKIDFAASSSARTGVSTISVVGTSGSFSQTLSISFAVSAALSSTGKGVPVSLSSVFNLYGIYTDGTTYTTGGLDGTGYSYSETLLGTSRVLNTALFNLGPANQPDAVGCGGQTISLPTGNYSGPQLVCDWRRG